ncbi:branched-chain amino acid ABC transporter substrate-binding protein [Rhizobium tubonense]|uniref:Branched-chain amino acid ABC transporter substrate-binding protein n=1 Tax=Rhizobium tubonense TaxID=484088 RepID=A0A2W4EPU0_9HYPH|nr:branched-chain amino acid ABC transporter substrate-binding protein [Rhizobium tubonense]PZM13163.1 branched-chain amino acid ABC transporter substrate-binding protein [Rhizobium tubonense]
MNDVRGILLLVSLLLAAGSSHAAGVTIGVVAPQMGTYASLGAQITAGAGFESETSKNTIVPVDEPCTENSGQAVADALIKAKVQIAIGFLCSETLEGALPKLKDAGIPAITVSVRSHILMEDALKNGWPLFRLAPIDSAEAKKVVETIIGEWAAKPIALIDDGTIHGRELVEAVRNALEEQGLKPVFVDTYRPGQEQQIGLVRRLRKAGATNVFIGGDRSDVAILARDAAAEKIPLVLMGGDAMRAADQPLALAAGVQAVTLPTYATLPPGLAAAKALRDKGIEPEGYVLRAAAAAAIASQVVEATIAEKKPLLDKLIGTTWQTALGPIAFGANHELTANPYRVLRWNGKDFQPADGATD